MLRPYTPHKSNNDDNESEEKVLGETDVVTKFLLWLP